MILSGTRPANHHRLPAAGDCADQPRNRVSERHRVGLWDWIMPEPHPYSTLVVPAPIVTSSAVLIAFGDAAIPPRSTTTSAASSAIATLLLACSVYERT